MRRENDPLRQKVQDRFASLRLVRGEDAVKAPVFADDDDEVLDWRVGD
jgi:hypothetical protein